VPLTTLNVRATEYTVGPNGPKLMPAELPPTSGYTYAVELSSDEAVASGAKTVNFTQPLYFYYDRDKGVWVPSPDGRVIKILGIANGLADVDTDGDGITDNNPSLGITDQERVKLAGLYTIGQSLWRVPIYHFTSYDCNYGVGRRQGLLIQTSRRVVVVLTLMTSAKSLAPLSAVKTGH
jgi:hypothetical protein